MKEKILKLFAVLLALSLVVSCVLEDEESTNSTPQMDSQSSNPVVAEAIQVVKEKIATGEMEHGTLNLSRVAGPTGITITPAGPISVNTNATVNIVATAPTGANLYVWELYKDGVRTPYPSNFTPMNTQAFDITDLNYGSGDYDVVCTIIISLPTGMFQTTLNSNTVSITFNVPDLQEVARFHFDGNLKDEKTGEVGTLHGTTSGYEAGLNRQALSLNNTGTTDHYVNDYAQLPDSKVNDTFTVSLWTKYRSISNPDSAQSPIFSIGRCKLENTFSICTYPNGNIRLITMDKQHNYGEIPKYMQFTSITANIKDEQWHHILVTYENRVFSLYVDNQLIDTITVDSRYTPNYLGLTQYLGIDMDDAIHSSHSYYNGLIDQLNIYKTALPVSEIAKLYHQYR